MKIHRDFGLLLWGNGVSTLGTSVYLIAVLLLLKDMTESVFLLGVFQFVALIPGFILSPLTGVLVDRWSRRSIIIYSDLVRGAAMTGAAALLVVPAFRSPALVLVVSAVIGAGNAFFLPAAQALIPDIVSRENLQAANGTRAATSQGCNLAGNALGGVLYATLGAPLVFLLNGVTFFLSALQETAIRAPRDRIRNRTRNRTGRQGAAIPGEGARSFLREMARGLNVVASRPAMAAIVFSQAGLFLLSPALLLSLPFIVIDELGFSGAVVGAFFAVSLLGGIATFLVLGRIPVDRVLDLPVIPVAYGVIALVFTVLGTTIVPASLVPVAFAFGGAAGAVYLFTVTWIQVRGDVDLHGRLFALLEAGNSLVAPVSYIATGFVLEMIGAAGRPRLFLALALVALLWAVWVLRGPANPEDGVY